MVTVTRSKLLWLKCLQIEVRQLTWSEAGMGFLGQLAFEKGRQDLSKSCERSVDENCRRVVVPQQSRVQQHQCMGHGETDEAAEVLEPRWQGVFKPLVANSGPARGHRWGQHGFTMMGATTRGNTWQRSWG